MATNTEDLLENGEPAIARARCIVLTHQVGGFGALGAPQSEGSAENTLRALARPSSPQNPPHRVGGVCGESGPAATARRPTQPHARTDRWPPLARRV